MRILNGRCTSTARLDGKTAIVTGSSTGIGKRTVKDFFKRGARVVMLCRNLEKANQAANDIKKKCEGQKNLGEIIIEELDLSSLKSIKNCANKLNLTEDRINILVNNAGVIGALSRTEDGFEMQFGTNHLGHFYLTLLLLPKIIRSAPVRIVNVSSMVHRRGHIDFEDLNWETRKYSAMKGYCQSKLANVLFTKELARRLQAAGTEDVTVYCLHPGVIRTKMWKQADETHFRGLGFLSRNLAGWFMKTPHQGAQTTIYCAVDENAAKETGLYYEDCEVARESRRARNMDDARRLWEVSFKLVKLPEEYNPFRID